MATVQPPSDVDVRLEVYSELTRNDATAEVGELGITEKASFIVRHDGQRFFVVARVIAGSGNALIRLKRPN